MNWKPKRKVNAGVIAGVVVVIGAWLVQMHWTIVIPAEVASAITTLCTFLVSWLIPDAIEE